MVAMNQEKAISIEESFKFTWWNWPLASLDVRWRERSRK